METPALLEKAFRHIIDQHYGILFKIGRAYTRDDADFADLYQEILIQLWESYPRFKGQSKLSTWIYRVALNTALTHSRKGKRRPRGLSIENEAFRIADDSLRQSEKVRQKERNIELLYDCINELKKDERAIILLHLDGNSYDEIAQIIGISISNVGVRLLRTKKKLQKLLIAKGYERI